MTVPSARSTRASASALAATYGFSATCTAHSAAGSLLAVPQTERGRLIPGRRAHNAVSQQGDPNRDDPRVRCVTCVGRPTPIAIPSVRAGERPTGARKVANAHSFRSDTRPDLKANSTSRARF